MLTTNFTEFRQHARDYFDQVEHGASITITRHGKAVAKIVPIDDNQSYWKQPHQPLTIPGISLSKEILKQRKEERS